MGNTVFDEQGNWRGVKLVVPAPLVVAYKSITTGIGTVYTVPSGRTLYLSWYSVTGGDLTSELWLAQVYVISTGSPILELARVGSPAAGGGCVVCPCSIPLQIQAGYSIKIAVNTGTPTITASIQGWLE